MPDADKAYGDKVNADILNHKVPNSIGRAKKEILD